MRIVRALILLILAAAWMPSAQARESRVASKGKRITVPGFATQAAYYFLPEDFDKEKTYHLFMVFMIHNSGEESAFGLSNMVDEGDTIVAAMNMLSTSYYSYSRYRRDRPWLRVGNLYKALRKNFRLHPKMFIATEEEGARPMQDFAYSYSKTVCGMAIHDPDYMSGVQWNTPRIPTLLTCGSSYSSYSLRNIEKFLADCKSNNYRSIKFQTVPGYADLGEGTQRELMVDFYQRCIGSPEAGVPKEIVAAYNKAGELTKIDEYAEAIALLRPIADSKDAKAFQKKARELLVKIGAAAGERLAAADKIADTSRDNAIDMYRDIARKFAGTNAAQAAEGKLKAMGVAVVDPKAKPKTPTKEPIREPVEPEPPEPAPDSKEEVRAQKLCEEGERLLAEGHRDRALSCFRAAALHRGTRAGRKAESKIEELSKTAATVDPPVKPDEPVKPDKPVKPPVSAADRLAKQCEQWLGLARNYINNKRYDQAKTYLRRVIQKNPNSTYAAEARVLLETCGQ